MYNRLWRDEDGLATVEYAVLLVLLVAGAAALWHAFGGQIKTGVSNANTSFASVNGDGSGNTSSPSATFAPAITKPGYWGQ